LNLVIRARLINEKGGSTHQRGRQTVAANQTAAKKKKTMHHQASWPHGGTRLRSTVNRLDMAEKQVVALQPHPTPTPRPNPAQQPPPPPRPAPPTSQPAPAACPFLPSSSLSDSIPIQWPSGARAGLTRPAFSSRPCLDLLPPAPGTTRCPPQAAAHPPDRWMILVGGGEGKETPC
jgi:hypothetical protein